MGSQPWGANGDSRTIVAAAAFKSHTAISHRPSDSPAANVGSGCNGACASLPSKA